MLTPSPPPPTAEQRYCSSDLWVGSAQASQATLNYAFQGHTIAMAAITDLVATQGMGSTPGARLLFGGCSAGAIGECGPAAPVRARACEPGAEPGVRAREGAMNNMDYVAELVASLAPSVQVQGFLDAAALVDVYPAGNGWSWGADDEPLQTMIAAMYAMVDPVVPPACASLYSGVDAWKCIFPAYRMPMLATPLFVTWAQFDSFQLGLLMDNYVPETAGQLAFAEKYQQAVLAAIATLPPGTGIFSTTCFVHCLTGHR